MRQRILISMASMFIITLLYSVGTCTIDIWTYSISMFVIVVLTYLMVRQQKRYDTMIEKVNVSKLHNLDKKV